MAKNIAILWRQIQEWELVADGVLGVDPKRHKEGRWRGMDDDVVEKGRAWS